VRVFEQGSLGIIDPVGAYIGGSRKLNVNGKLYFPVPGTGNDKSLRIFAFLDAGDVWNSKKDARAVGLDIDTGYYIRSSAGLGLSWMSPMGPLELSWGNPVRAKSTDRIQKFQFQIGTAF